ncbi:MAG: hypothetical protein A3H28_09805 [Acidobacteria bacterium RIFCSPLOWO2_02_FULL_61_28]|nr:MAG: hypothetical protein A3H28_09805 [Acidobacteria bacterium RIFCSPLOWO2_02_FULL_61_28]
MGSRPCDGNNFLDLVHFLTARKRERRAAAGSELPDLRAQLPPQGIGERRASLTGVGLAVDEDSR